ncbi:Ger(x)C family spore germination protein [Metabacillus sp. 84]|uniref:Ger(x)C family spore germination protein n=1 Tax=unclassified Metabacillus TaxID=2675274 RepID=UPI003CE6AC2A
MKKWPLLIAICILLASCGRVELNELAIISGLGFDESSEGLSMSMQLVNPGATAKSKGANDSGGTGGSVFTYTITGRNITEIMEKARNLFSRKVYFSHVSVILIGEQLARKKGFLPIIDYLERYYQIRDNINMFVAKESSAKEILSVYLPIQNMPALSISRRIEIYGGSMGLERGIEIQDVVRWSFGSYIDPVIPGIRKKIEMDASETSVLEQIDGDQKMFEMTGLAYFGDRKLSGWFTQEESRGWALLTGKAAEFETSVDCPGYPGEQVGLRFKQTKGRIRVSSLEPLLYTAGISAKAVIQEVTCPVILEKGSGLKEIEKKAEQKLKEEMQKTFSKTVSSGSDPLGLGQLLYENHYSDWRRMKKQWEQLYKTAKLEPAVDISIEQTGLRVKSVYEK